MIVKDGFYARQIVLDVFVVLSTRLLPREEMSSSIAYRGFYQAFYTSTIQNSKCITFLLQVGSERALSHAFFITTSAFRKAIIGQNLSESH